MGSGEHAIHVVYSTSQFRPSTKIYKTQTKIRDGQSSPSHTILHKFSYKKAVNLFLNAQKLLCWIKLMMHQIQ